MNSHTIKTQMDMENLGDIEISLPENFETSDPEVDQNCPPLVREIV